MYTTSSDFLPPRSAALVTVANAPCHAATAACARSGGATTASSRLSEGGVPCAAIAVDSGGFATMLPDRAPGIWLAAAGIVGLAFATAELYGARPE